jgi:thiol-disulfide isomerase/thioredoxin
MMMLSLLFSVVFLGETSFAAEPSDEKCPVAASKYDPCQNQELIYSQALSQAAEKDKKLLLLFGADWCPWCISFQRFLESPVNQDLLKNFAVANIAIFHGRTGSPTGKSVMGKILQMGKLSAGMSDRLPGIAIVDPKNKRAVFLDSLLLRESPDSKAFDAKKFRESVAKALRDLDKPLGKAE